MEEVAWSSIALLAVTTFGSFWFVAGKVDTINARIDALGERLDARIDAMASRLDAQIDSIAAQIQAHIEHHPS